eukprot:355524-Chlamydomonas_euryale.AAC.2
MLFVAVGTQTQCASTIRHYDYPIFPQNTMIVSCGSVVYFLPSGKRPGPHFSLKAGRPSCLQLSKKRLHVQRSACGPPLVCWFITHCVRLRCCKRTAEMHTRLQNCGSNSPLPLSAQCQAATRPAEIRPLCSPARVPSVACPLEWFWTGSICGRMEDSLTQPQTVDGSLQTASGAADVAAHGTCLHRRGMAGLSSVGLTGIHTRIHAWIHGKHRRLFNQTKRRDTLRMTFLKVVMAKQRSTAKLGGHAKGSTFDAAFRMPELVQTGRGIPACRRVPQALCRFVSGSPLMPSSSFA